MSQSQPLSHPPVLNEMNGAAPVHADSAVPETPLENGGGLGFDTFADKLAFVFAEHNLPFSLLRSGSSFRQILPREYLEGKNLFPETLSKRILLLSKKTKEEVFKELRGEDVFLMLDGATCSRRTYLGFGITHNEVAYFLDDVEIKGVNDAEAIGTAIRGVLGTLKDAQINVFSAVADNAAVIQKALTQLHATDSEWTAEADVVFTEVCEEGDSGSEAEDHEIDDNCEETEACDTSEEAVSTMESILEECDKVLKNEGIFVYRCSSHSLQLVLGDILTKIPRIQTWKKKVMVMVETYTSRSGAANLERVQVEADETPLKVIRPTSVRWNSLFDCCLRLAELKKWMYQPDQAQKQFWSTLKWFITIAGPIASATDTLQRNGCTFVEFISTLQGVEDKLKACEDKFSSQEDLNDFKALMKIFELRKEKNFAFDGVLVYKFLNPSTDTSGWSQQKVDYTFELTKTYALAHARSHCNGEFDAEKIGKKIDDGLADHYSTQASDYHQHWKRMSRSHRELARFARALGNSAHSEAVVERHFKKLKMILTKTRASLSSKMANACLWLAINHPELRDDIFQRSKKRKARSTRTRRLGIKKRKIVDEALDSSLEES